MCETEVLILAVKKGSRWGGGPLARGGGFSVAGRCQNKEEVRNLTKVPDRFSVTSLGFCCSGGGGGYARSLGRILLVSGVWGGGGSGVRC